MSECWQQKYTQHAPSMKMECDYACGWIERKGHICKNITKNGEYKRSSWEHSNYNRIPRRNLRFFTISSLRCEPPPTRTLKWPWCSRVQITCNTSSTYHVQHVVLHATWYEGTAQLLSWQIYNRIYLSFFLLAEPLNWWRRGGNRSTRRKPLATSFRYYCPKVQAPWETRTQAAALVTG